MEIPEYDLRRVLVREIEQVKAQVSAGIPASKIASELHERGLSTLQLVGVFHYATGASLKNLKDFSQWWGPRGIIDVEAFDRHASEVLNKGE